MDFSKAEAAQLIVHMGSNKMETCSKTIYLSPSPTFSNSLNINSHQTCFRFDVAGLRFSFEISKKKSYFLVGFVGSD
jgi:hypothetical protein